MLIDKKLLKEKLSQLKQKLSYLKEKAIAFIVKWSNIQTWKECFIPENPKEHPRLVRFLLLTISLLIITSTIIFITSFAILRISEPTVKVPSLEGSNITDAIILLQSSKLDPFFEMIYNEDYPKYQIIKQYPNQGSSVKEGRKINLIVSLGADQYTVPQLCGLDKEDALTILNEQRIPYLLQVVPAGEQETNKVIAMNFSKDTTVPRDNILVLTITDAILANQYRMNNFVRQPLEFTANTLYNNRITPIIVTTNVTSLADDGLVLDQSTPEGDILTKNTSTIITVGLYPYNEGEKENLKWHVFKFTIPKVDNYQRQIIITNDDGILEDASEGQPTTAKFYTAIVEDELGRQRTIYERLGAEGTSFIRVFKAYGKANVYVYADNEVIGSRAY